jgi:deoxyribonuclease-4
MAAAKTKDWQIGAHLKMEDPLAMAAATDSAVVQIFLSDPQGWKKPAPRDDAEALRASKIPVIVHAPYIVNLASANNKIRIPSRKVLQQTMDAAAEIGARAVVVHGGHVDANDTVEAGVERWVKGLESLETDVPLYLENTAGGDHAMARHFETIDRLWSAIGSWPGIGFCLDTCHAFAAGEEMATAVERILAITGRIDLVHCNDSKDPHGSGRDRHEHLGAGTIDPSVLVETVRLAGAPVICETPMDGVKDDIAFLRDRL